MLNLTPRLKAIAESIDRCDVMADIGSDHAYLPIYLVEKGKAVKAIATDINKGPADISAARVKKCGLGQSIEIRIGDGLKVLGANEADVIVIAGMGGLLMQSMLKESIDIARSARKIILQPMRDSEPLIKWLIENSFEIFDGEIIKENDKFYKIIWVYYKGNCCRSIGIMPESEVLYYKNNSILHEYIDNKINEYKKIINHLSVVNTINNQKRIDECIGELEKYREALKWLNLNAEQ